MICTLVNSDKGVQYAAVLDALGDVLGEGGNTDGVAIQACHRAAAAAFALRGEDRVVDLPVDEVRSVFGVRVTNAVALAVVYFDVEELRAVLPPALAATTERLLATGEEWMLPPRGGGTSSPPAARAFVVRPDPEDDPEGS